MAIAEGNSSCRGNKDTFQIATFLMKIKFLCNTYIYLVFWEIFFKMCKASAKLKFYFLN